MTNWQEEWDNKLKLHDPNQFYTPLLARLEEATKVQRLYIVLGAFGILAFYLIIGNCAELLCNLIGFAYPAYQSVKALESSNKEDDTKWLTYWVVCAAFHIVDFFSDKLLSWFPLYWLMKCVFLVWCYIPIENNGSMIIYNRFLRPFFLDKRNQIDKAISDLTNKAASAMKKD
jgi:receptor expression-enhancing protein 5/6